MAKTRKVINAKDLNTNELVYFKGHAKATYMSDGVTVEDAIKSLSEGTADGTITGIYMNGALVGDSGIVDLGTVLTEHQDISGKQDLLVDGINIKTINGESILGSGDITINITEVTEKPKTNPTKNELLVDSENNKVYIGLGGKGWWAINAEKLMTSYVKNNTLYIDGNVSNETLGIDFGDVKNNNLII